MTYDFTQCFWDPNDDGANLLQHHIKEGVRSTNTLLNFFKNQAEIEKDFSRRQGAVYDKFVKDFNGHGDFGNVNKILDTLMNYQQVRAKAFGKQSELIYSRLYIDTKTFISDINARAITVDGKIERMRSDKVTKKKNLEEINKKLNNAQIKSRDLALNIDNIIANKKQREVQQAEFNKSKNLEDELQNQLDFSKQELKSSQSYWLQEWAILSKHYQEIEESRINFLQEKLQEFIEGQNQTLLIEQTKLDKFFLQLSSFTPKDDIEQFSKKNGTGRLKDKRNDNKNKNYHHNHHKSSSSNSRNVLDPSHSLNSNRASSSVTNHSHPIQRRVDSRERFKESLQFWQSTSSNESSKTSNSNEEHLTRKSYDKDISVLHNKVVDSHNKNHGLNNSSSEYEHSENSHLNKNNYKIKNRLELPKINNTYNHHHHTLSNSSNDSDYHSRRSHGSSISSMSSTIIEGTFQSDGSTKVNNYLKKDHYSIPISPENSDSEDISTKKKFKGRIRNKSMVRDDSTHPIEDALYEMNKLQEWNLNAKEDPKVGRIRDSGITVTLPILTSEGIPVRNYAKALYPLVDNPSSELCHFHRSDYLLITEKVDDDWYKGEVYGNDMINASHKVGLIPNNFIRILK